MFALLFTAAAIAAPCGPTAQARMDTAELLITESASLELVAQLDSVQQAREILERTTQDFPRCRAASRMNQDVKGIAIRLRPAAEAAAQEQTIARLERHLAVMEEEAAPSRAHVQHMVRSVAALQGRYPESQRVEELSYRLALLGGSR